jgi:hypothetical protein
VLNWLENISGLFFVTRGRGIESRYTARSG